MRRWPLTGRAAELAAVRGALTQPGPGGGVAIVGPAGVGKSRLAQEASAALGRIGAGIGWVQATASVQQVPLGAFAGLVDGGADDPLRLCSRAAQSLATKGTVGLVVDDAHRLDPLSAALVLHLATNAALRLLVTVRSGEPVPDAVAALWKEALVERVDLAPLPVDAAAELVRAVLVDPVETGTAEALAGLGAGNPLYLREIVLGELRAGRLVRAGGQWVWAGGFRASAGLVELVEASALAVPEPVRDVLDLVAAAGDLTVDVVLRCVDAEAVETAERSGLVVLDPVGRGQRVRAFHPLYAEVRRARMGRAAQRRWRGLAGSALRPRAAGPGLPLVQAALLLDSDAEPDAAALAGAAEKAIRLFDYGLGERLAQAAVDAGGGFEAGMLLAFAQGWSNHLAAASATCARMVATSATDVERLRSTVAAAGHNFFMCGDPATGLAALEAGRRAIGDPEVGALLDALGSFFAACLGRPADAVRLARPVLERPALAPQLEVCALFGLVSGLGFAGRLDDAGPLAERAWRVGATVFDATHLRLGLVYLHVCGLLAAGRVREAVGLAGRRDHEIVAGVTASAMAGGFCGAASLAAGDISEATRRLERCCAAIANDTSGWRYHATALLARAYALSGRTAEAVGTAELAETLVHDGHAWFEPERLLTRSWVAAAEGAVSEAVQLCRRAAQWAATHDQLVHEVLARQTAVRFGDASGQARLAALATLMDGSRAPAAVLHARGVAASDPDALEAAADAYLGLGDRLSAADAYAQAVVVLAARGRPGARIDAARRATELQQECAAVTPALRAALYPLPLAPREREVATMAAHGLPNRTIAARLQLSVRTVEGHLYRAYGRLGVGSRAELASVLTAPSCLGGS